MPEYISKGNRVRARWLKVQAPGSYSLAGVQAKVAGSFVEVVGICRHFRADNPVMPHEVRIYLDIEGALPEDIERVQPPGCTCKQGHVEIRPEWIAEVL